MTGTEPVLCITTEPLGELDEGANKAQILKSEAKWAKPLLVLLSSIVQAEISLQKQRLAGISVTYGAAEVTTDFRRFCREKGIRLDAVSIATIFTDYCNKTGVLP